MVAIFNELIGKCILDLEILQEYIQMSNASDMDLDWQLDQIAMCINHLQHLMENSNGDNSTKGADTIE